MVLNIYKKNSKTPEVSMFINYYGYGALDPNNPLISFVESYTPEKIIDLFTVLEGRLSKKNTGILIYYLSSMPDARLTLTRW